MGIERLKYSCSGKKTGTRSLADMAAAFYCVQKIAADRGFESLRVRKAG